jgi:hypothetical protein
MGVASKTMARMTVLHAATMIPAFHGLVYIQAEMERLVDERSDDGAVRHRCPGDGASPMRCCITQIAAANTPAKCPVERSGFGVRRR